MKIGVIGAGAFGGALVRKFRQLDYEVFVANSRGPESLESLTKETGAHAVILKDVVKDVEIVVFTIPPKSIETLPKDLFQGVPKSVVIIDTGNYYPNIRDGVIPELENGTTESTWFSQNIGRPVIKALNNIIAHSLVTDGKPFGEPGRVALPISGDDLKDKVKVMKLVEELGFDAVDAGSLDESWRQEPGTPAYCTNLNVTEIKNALSIADRKRSQKLRKILEQEFTKFHTESSSYELIQRAREIQTSPAISTALNPQNPPLKTGVTTMIKTNHLDAYLDAMNKRDVSTAKIHMADNVVLRSPIVTAPCEGKENVANVLAQLLGTIDSFEPKLLLRDNADFVAVFTIKQGDNTIDGMDHMHLNEDGYVDSMTVAWRPMQAIVAVQQKLAPKLGIQAMKLVSA